MSQEPATHFDHLSTSWTLLHEAHHPETSSDRRAEARGQLLARYESVIRRYLGGALRYESNREEAVNECFQRFSVKVLDGSLQGANPERGKFRPYLRTCLQNLVTDYQRDHRRQMTSLAGIEPVAEDATVSDEEYKTMCREDLVARALQELAQQEQMSGGVLYYFIKLKMERPELRSRQLAELATAHLDRPVNDGWVRKRVLEARRRLCALLRREVGRELLQATDERIDEEMAELGLLEYCRSNHQGASK